MGVDPIPVADLTRALAAPSDEPNPVRSGTLGGVDAVKAELACARANAPSPTVVV